MKGKSIHNNVANYSLIEDISSQIVSAVTMFFEQVRTEQEKARRQLKQKHRILNEYHLEMIDGMPLEERLKMGNYRF